MNARQTVDAYFRAMQAGPEAAEALFALFAPDATYVEPFSGRRQTHQGRVAIEAYLRGSWESAPPDMTLTVDRVDAVGAVVTTRWTCDSPAFPHPMRGRDVCTVKDGLIAHLDVTFLEA
jgi:ketosteroid isomerase-like protein